jgi:hypothetical protein
MKAMRIGVVVLCCVVQTRLCLAQIQDGPGFGANSAEDPGPAVWYTVNVEPLPEVVLLGSSVPVRIRIGNAAPVNLPLPFDVDAWGAPSLLMRLLDANGVPVSSTRAVGGLLGVLPKPLQLRRGQTVEFRYDLAMLYRIEAPGQYTLRFKTDRVVHESQLNVAAYRVLSGLSEFQVHGRYRPPYIGARAPDANDGRPLDERSSVRLSVVEADYPPRQPPEPSARPLFFDDPDAGKPPRPHFLLIDQIVVMSKARIGLPSYSHPVAPRSTIERADMDDFGQVWVLVKSDDKRSLLLWCINDLSWRVLVPPTEKRITFEVGQAFFLEPESKLIAAGVEGGEAHSSYSVMPYSFGGTGKVEDILLKGVSD